MHNQTHPIVPEAKIGQPLKERWPGPGRELSRKLAVFQQILLAGRQIFSHSGANNWSPETKVQDPRYLSTFLGMGYLTALLSQVPIWDVNEKRCPPSGTAAEERHTIGKTGMTKTQLQHLGDDCIRMFAELQHIDARRALWFYARRPDDTDLFFKRLVRASQLLYHMFPSEDFGLTIVRYDVLFHMMGAALWQASYHVPHSLSVSPPPPPYTRFKFNIQHMPMESAFEQTMQGLKHGGPGEEEDSASWETQAVLLQRNRA
jgi:hypothetical protein